MVRIPNPYRPGFNQPPGFLAGRGKVLEAVKEALDVAALDNRTPRPIVLTGGRGVGKTVLLGDCRSTDGIRRRMKSRCRLTGSRPGCEVPHGATCNLV